MENNSKNYPLTILEARTYSMFITIPQTTIDYKKLHAEVSNYKQIIHLITKLEQHEDKGLHIHMLIKFKQQVAIKQIHNIIFKQEGIIKGLIDYDKVKNYQASINYVNKEDTSIPDMPPLEYGVAPMFTQGGDRKSIEIKTTLEAIEKAEQGDLEGALQDIKNLDPLKYLQYKQVFQENLKTENKTLKKWDLPNFKKDAVKLSTKQQQVWDLLQEAPKARRIIWISGSYGSGKSFLYNYINENYEYGMYNAGSSASMDNVVYGYNEEGTIAWDLPRTFNFNELGDALASVIEKFSDFGQSISSKKYSGKTQKVRGHAIVFSNQQPIEQLKHRDIVYINLDEEKSNEIKEITHLNTPTNQQLQSSKETTGTEPIIAVVSKPIIKYNDKKKLYMRLFRNEHEETAIVYKETYEECQNAINPFTIETNQSKSNENEE